MTFVLLGSLALRLAALVLAIMLLRRRFGLSMLFLAGALALLTVRQVAVITDSTLLSAEVSGLLVSVMALGAVFFLARVLREKRRVSKRCVRAKVTSARWSRARSTSSPCSMPAAASCT